MSDSILSQFPNQVTSNGIRVDYKPVWLVLLAVCLILLSLLLISVPFLTSGSELWLGIDWLDGRKLYSIDDAYRYFAAKNAFRLQSIVLWNYIMPVALFFDAATAVVTDGSLLGMRLFHAGVGVVTLVVIARASLRSGCGPLLAIASVLIVGLMPLYLILSSSFYGEGLFALLLVVAFLLLIEERNTFLAITVGLLPLVRPEGAIYCVLFLVYFGLRRDAKCCALIVLPGLVYVAAVFSFSAEWLSTVTWRLELRKILSPLDQATTGAVSLDRLPNALWVCLALASPLIPRWRKWWPILLGPLCLLVIQASAIGRGFQGFELRYFFSMLPIFGVAWAFPIRSLLDRSATTTIHRRLYAPVIIFGTVAIIGFHMLQSDWVRQFYAESELPRDMGLEFRDKALWYDPRPLQGFAGRVDAFIESHEDIQTIFIANSAPLYFLDFLHSDRQIEPVLIPHNSGVAAYSGGYFFGFSLERLAYRYYKFDAVDPGESAPAILIIDDAGRSPFNFPGLGEKGRTATETPHPRSRATARVQSGSLNAYSVNYRSRDSVDWSIPALEE